MFGSLLKATTGVLIDLPVSVVKDSVTLGGTLIDEESSTLRSLENIITNIENSVTPKN